MISGIKNKLASLKKLYKDELSTARYYAKLSQKYEKDTFGYNRCRSCFSEHLTEAKLVKIQIEKLESFNGDEFQQSIVDMLENYFPDRYDISDTGFIVHFPEITITSSYGKTRDLTDIYIKVDFHDVTNVDIKVSGTRMSATMAEIKSQ